MKTGKDLSYYKSLHYKMVVGYDADEDVHVVRFPDLPGCIMHAESAEEAVQLGLKVKDEWLELAFSKGWIISEPMADLETTGRLTLRLPKSLHKRVIDRAEWEGVSLNQLILSFVAEGLGKTEAENSLEKIAAKQDELINLLRAAQTPKSWRGLVDVWSRTADYVSDITAGTHSMGAWCNLLATEVAASSATANASTIVATLDNIYSLGPATIEDEKEGFRPAKTKVIAFRGTYQGGHANEA